MKRNVVVRDDIGVVVAGAEIQADAPVFDKSKFGERMLAERHDQPGQEISLAGYGVRGLLDGDTGGDWSFKPYRDKLLGENFKTYRPTLHPLAGIRF